MFRIRTSIDQRCENSSYLGIVSTYSEINPNIIIGSGITGPTGTSGIGSGSTGPTGTSGSIGPTGSGITGPTGASGMGESLVEIITQSTGTTMTPSGTTIFSGFSPLYKTSFLPDALSVGTIKTIEMEYPTSSPVNIITTHGNTSLENSLTKRSLLFTNNGWKIQDSSYTSFYPSNINFIASFTGSTEASISSPTFDTFGISVDMDSAGSTAVVGAPFNISGATMAGNSIGCITIFSTGTGVWDVETSIIPTNYTGDATQIQYGKSVSISDDGSVIAVGAPADNSINGRGAVWIYKKISGVWIEKQKITGSWALGHSFPSFGLSVDVNVDGSLIVVSGISSEPESSIWVFKNDGFDNWVEAQNFLETIGPISAGYSYCKISAQGNTIINWSNTVITIFERIYPNLDYWEMVSIQINCEIYPAIYNSVDLSSDGSQIAVGSRQQISSNFPNGGEVKIFTKLAINNWILTTEIPTPNNSYMDFFGYSVGFSDDAKTLAVGATKNSSGDEQSVYIYNNNNNQWILKQTIVPTPLITGGRFGESVSISGDGRSLLVGSPSDGSIVGGVFFYD